MKVISKSVILSFFGILLSANLAQGMQDPNLPLNTSDPQSLTEEPKKFDRSSFGAIPADIFSGIILPFLQLEGIRALNFLTKDPIWQKIIQNSRRYSPFGVRLRDLTWMYFPEAVYKRGSSEIVHFNDVDCLINHLPSWKQETIAAAQKGREPEYLKAISALYKEKIDAFIFAKEATLLENGASKGQWQRHAFSVFFTYRAVLTSTRNAARSAFWNPIFDSASNAASNSAYDAASNATYNAASNAAYNAASNAARNAANDSANKAAYYAAYYAVGNEIERLDLHQPEELGRLVHRVTEKVALVVYLRHTKDVFNASYLASLNALPENPEGIFTSKASWDEHREQFLATALANPHQAHFIRAWIDHLDRIATKIDTLDY